MVSTPAAETEWPRAPLMQKPTKDRLQRGFQRRGRWRVKVVKHPVKRLNSAQSFLPAGGQLQPDPATVLIRSPRDNQPLALQHCQSL